VQKILLDTNIYIDWLNEGSHDHLMLGPGRVRYLSALVAMELRIGARTSAAQKAVGKLTRAYEKGRRLIAPTPALYEQAGDVLARLTASGHSIRRAAVTHDVLIALTGRFLGATVITRDTKDFKAIDKVLDFRWEAIRSGG
jgi:predicted nucleic acid-binding protein